jgi:maltose alpha-D-glucosyltransferase/alpha-amylase
MSKKATLIGREPLWYKDAIIYELHVKSFLDSNADGIGDFKGVVEKLDYLEDLGVNAIWLLPFYPSPLRDDGYDIADYMSLNSDYGTLRDFRTLLNQAHKRGIRVITELVINHTSDQHPWFQRARKSKPGSNFRDFYVWSDTPDKYRDARIIFKDFEPSNWSWDPVAKAYYWHRFYSHQPDLNFNNPRVRKEIFKILHYWFDMGVDGLRLDAIPYLLEEEGTNCENLEETHQVIKEIRGYVDDHFEDKLLLAEANQWPEDAAEYFGDGDECHMAFHFPVMPRLFMAFKMEDRFPIIDILEQTPEIPPTCQWAMFLRNHDELTLEMVTDEERDYMYRVFAQDPRARINLGIRRRLAPLLDNNRRKIELMNILLFSMPGTPVIYYGDEIGMGDNYYLGDRDGVRTPMQWSADRNAGFSRANPQKLFLPVIIDPEYHFESLNVENQERNVSSFLWWMKRVIAMRKRFQAFSRGTIKFFYPDNPKVLVFTREFEGESILVIINLSRFSQFVEIDLAEFEGYIPEEVFSHSQFPEITEKPYFLSLGPHGHFWFLLQKQEKEIPTLKGLDLVTLQVRRHWTQILEKNTRAKLERHVLPDYLKSQRWFGGKARTIRKTTIVEHRAMDQKKSSLVLNVKVEYTVGSAETYVLPVAFASNDHLDEQIHEPKSVMAIIQVGDRKGILYDGIYNEGFRASLLSLIVQNRKISAEHGEIVSTVSKKLGRWFKSLAIEQSRVLKAEQSNSSILYDDKLFLKLYRRLESGINPDPEIIRFLSEQTKFENVPLFAGSLEYRQESKEPQVVALLQQFVPNEGDAWELTLSSISQYFERVLAKEIEPDFKLPPFFDAATEDFDPDLLELIGGVTLEQAFHLGTRTGEMHLALASSNDHPDFAPEPFSKLYQRSLYQALRSGAIQSLQGLEKNINVLPEEHHQNAREILERKPEIIGHLRKITQGRISAHKIRIHGDYHLGQVLFTGKDFVIIDFEGEPARPTSERRLKYSCFRDVSGMMRSYHYAVYTALFQRSSIRKEDVRKIEKWTEPWYRAVASTFLRAYMEKVNHAPFVPKEKQELEILLNVFLINKALYELDYELNNRPDWIVIPVQGLNMILEDLRHS